MVAKIFDDILLKGIRSGQAPAKSAEAREWYRAEAKTVTKSKANPEQIIKEMKGRNIVRYEYEKKRILS